MRLNDLRTLALISLVSLIAPLAHADDLKVSTDFPGGAADVVAIDQAKRTVRFRIPEQAAWKAWWYFRVSGIVPGETVTLELEDTKGGGFAQSVGDRMAFTLDGKAWQFSGKAVVSKEGFRSYAQKVEAKEALFAWYVPFLPTDTEAVVDAAVKACPAAEKFELCRSEADIPVTGIRFNATPDGERKPLGLWIHARQHAWEVGGSWAAAGLIEWLASADEKAVALRKRATVTIIPIFDVDSVAKGTGGKNQKPHDHNRDWSDKPHWKAVRTAMNDLVAMNDAGKLDLVLDLHDPGWAGTGGPEYWCSGIDKQPALRKENTLAFAKALEAEIVASEKTWPFKGVQQPNYILGQPALTQWGMTAFRPSVVVVAMEIPVAPPAKFTGAPPLPHKELGRQVGLGIERHFR